MRFCPKCGVDIEKGVFCRDCSIENLDLKFKDMVVKFCIECKKVFHKGSWSVYQEINDAIKKVAIFKISNTQKIPLTIIVPDFKPEFKPGLNQEISLLIIATYEGVDVEFEIPFTLEFTYCARCSKKDSTYFEGILQLRDVSQEIIDFVQADLKEKEAKGVFISKFVPLKNGMDFFLTSQRYLRNLGNRLTKKFNGTLKFSATLFTRNKETSKDVYRLSVLFRERKYKVGEIIEQNEKKIKIKYVGKRIHGVDTSNGKKVFVE
ncbi:hypothetical protein HOK51_05220 [Candidatus Woesearchaeota archaeon]|jgi:NMD protein affecting ribosome stability and mRNA decay|nr:hypothetical protein [Candidatus Woesearchaeota archaeon]MBT6519228.1 hypothetical protein [Candidatus Woesearchaeota archaeon]